jgi:hypothetical protein
LRGPERDDRYTESERKKWHALIKARDIKLD